MKKFALLLPMLLFGLLGLNAQSVPQGINYQTVVRGANGSPMPNANLVLKFEIKDGIGSILYSEEQMAQSNSNSLVNLIIGQGGTPTFSLFQDIDWSLGPRTLTIYLKNANGDFDPLGTVQLVSVPYAFYAEESAKSATAAQLADLGAQPGQVLQWNGTAWVPANDAVGGGGGSVSLVNTGVGLTGGPISTSGTISLGNTGVTPGIYGSTTKVPQITVDAQGRLSGVIELNVEAPAITLSEGNGIDVAVNGLNNFTVINTGDVDATDDVLKTTQHDGDLIGTYNTLNLKAGVVGTSELANEAVTAAKLDDMGANNGQVLKYMNGAWQPDTDLTGGNGNNYGEGAGIDITGAAPNFTIVNTGDTDPSNDLTTNSNAAGDVTGLFANLQIAGSAVGTPELANGAVTAAKLDDMGANNGQVLKYVNGAWQPDTDITGGNSNNYAEGTGIDITGSAPNFTIVNIGDTDPSNDLTTSSSAAGDVTGLFANLQIAGSAVGTPELANGAVTASKLNNMGATFNQVLKFNGTNWGPEDAGLVINGIGSGPGINQNGSSNGVIQINAEIDNAIWNANRLQGRQISANLPATGQVLQWNGTTWVPASVNGNGWEACGEAIPDRVGIGKCPNPNNQVRLDVGYNTNNQDKIGVNVDVSGAGVNRGMIVSVENGSTDNDGVIALAFNGANNNVGMKVVSGSDQIPQFVTSQNYGLYVDLKSQQFEPTRTPIKPSTDVGLYVTSENVLDDYAAYFDGDVGIPHEIEFIDPSNGNQWAMYIEKANEAGCTGLPSSNDDLLMTYNGNIRLLIRAADGAECVGSDRRLKENIMGMKSMLPAIRSLNPVSYYLKADPEKNPTFGFIAQEVKPIFPELVYQVATTDTPDLLTLNYTGFSVIAIKAIQEQQQIIDGQQAQLDSQESRLNALEKEMAELKALLKSNTTATKGEK